MTSPWPRRAAAAIALAAALLARVPGVDAQSLDLMTEGGGPLDITAEEGIEWHQDKQVFVARGNAKAIREDVTVTAHLLRAYYRETATGETEIWRLDAEQDVVIRSPSEAAYGERAVYDVDNAVLTMRGGDLRFVAGKDVIRARDQLEYWEQKRMAVARGDAIAVQGEKTLEAEILAAYFRRTGEGSGDGGATQVYRVDAFDNVVIRRPKETVWAERGVYNVESGIVTLADSVRIERGENVLTGCSAEVNLNTGISKLFSCPADGGGTTRVEGVLKPDEKQEQ